MGRNWTWYGTKSQGTPCCSIEWNALKPLQAGTLQLSFNKMTIFTRRDRIASIQYLLWAETLFTSTWNSCKFEMQITWGKTFCLKSELCFIRTWFSKPPPSTNMPASPEEAGRDHWFIYLFYSFDGRGRRSRIEVWVLFSSRRSQEWLPWSVYCPSESFGRDLTHHKTPHYFKSVWGEKGEENRCSYFYLMKFPPPISLLYLLVRWSACMVSLDSTPNSPLRW